HGEGFLRASGPTAIRTPQEMASILSVIRRSTARPSDVKRVLDAAGSPTRWDECCKVRLPRSELQPTRMALDRPAPTSRRAKARTSPQQAQKALRRRSKR